jgi:hypothetical protein
VKRLCEWNTCCCRYHTELRYLLDALNGMRIDEAGVHSSCTCKCLSVCGGGCLQEGIVCGASTATFSGLASFWSSVLCEKGVDEFWHSKDYLLGNCADCGVTTMLWVCSGELNSQKLVTWRCFGQEIVGVNSKGKHRKVVKLEHNFLATWQDVEFKEQLSNLPGHTILTYVDFS